MSGKKKRYIEIKEETETMPTQVVESVVEKFTTDNSWIAIITVVYFFVILIGMFHHEMWRDELQPWLVASSQATFSDFLTAMKTESNPLIWYSLFFIISKITVNPIIIQVLQIIVATSSVFLVMRYAPFSILQKILFVFGYYLLFEYGIISRGYCLTVFFLFLFCVLYNKYPKQYTLLAIVLVLLANGTGGHGVLLSAALSIMVGVNILIETKFLKNNYKNINPKLIVGSIILVSGIWFAYASIVPPDYSALKFSTFPTQDGSRFYINFWRSIWASYIPIPDFTTLHFWNTNYFIWHLTYDTEIYIVISSFIIVTFCLLMFITHLPSVIFFFTATFGILFFSYSNMHVYGNFAARHYGFLFIVFMTTHWLYSYRNKSNDFRINFLERNFFRKIHIHVITFLLFVNFTGGVIAYSKDFVSPFSASWEAKEFILNNNLDKYQAAGFIDYVVSPLSAYTLRPIYMADRDTTARYSIWTFKNYSLDNNVIIPRIKNYVDTCNDSVLVLVNLDLATNRIENMYFNKRASFTESVVPDETYHIYTVKKISEPQDVIKEVDALSSLTPYSKIVFYKELGEEFRNKKDYSAAEKIFTGLIKKFPEKRIPGLHGALGMTYSDKKLFSLAKKELQEELKINSNDANSYFSMAYYYLQMNNADSAIILYEKVIEMNPNHVDAYNNLGVCYFNNKKEFDKAYEYWRKTVEIKPDFIQGYINIMVYFQNKNDTENLLQTIVAVMNKGVTIDEIRNRGVAISDELLARIQLGSQ